jgi:hypothetical protein
MANTCLMPVTDKQASRPKFRAEDRQTEIKDTNFVCNFSDLWKTRIWFV